MVPVLPVSDVPASVRFYREILGFNLDRRGENETAHIASVSRNGHHIMLQRSKESRRRLRLDRRLNHRLHLGQSPRERPDQNPEASDQRVLNSRHENRRPRWQHPLVRNRKPQRCPLRSRARRPSTPTPNSNLIAGSSIYR